MTLTTEHLAHIPPPNNGALPHPATIFRLTAASTQLRKVTGLQKRWKSAELSCSREIDVSRRGIKKRAWWPCGPAMQKFDSEIVGEIEGLLKHVDLGDADIYLRLYMIGKSQEKSRPVIMVCCSNPRVRTQAEEAIRQSRIPEQYPEFALGASALPLEQPGLVRALAGMSGTTQAAGHKRRGYKSHKRSMEQDEDEDNEPPSRKRATLDWNTNTLAAAFISFPVGRRIYVGLRPATGGVIIRVDSRDYQLTVSHVMDDEPVLAPSDSIQQSMLDECHFDDMSDEEDEADPATSNESHEHPHSGYQPQPPFDPESTGYIPQYLTVSAYDSRNGPNPGLDYMLLPLDLITTPDRDPAYFSPNRIILPGGPRQRMLCIGEAVRIPAEQRDVAVATASSGVLRGVLGPAAVYFRNATLPRFQRLYPVYLDSPISLGDSGSAVVDEITGQLYGHIVRGAHQSTTAYVVAAAEVFEDLKQRTSSTIEFVTVLENTSSNHMAGEHQKTPRYPAGAGGLARYDTPVRSRFSTPPLAHVDEHDPRLVSNSTAWDFMDELKTPALTMTTNSAESTTAPVSVNDTTVFGQRVHPQPINMDPLWTFTTMSPVIELQDTTKPVEFPDESYFEDALGFQVPDFSTTDWSHPGTARKSGQVQQPEEESGFAPPNATGNAGWGQ